MAELEVLDAAREAEDGLRAFVIENQHGTRFFVDFTHRQWIRTAGPGRERAWPDARWQPLTILLGLPADEPDANPAGLIRVGDAALFYRSLREHWLTTPVTRICRWSGALDELDLRSAGPWRVDFGRHGQAHLNLTRRAMLFYRFGPPPADPTVHHVMEPAEPELEIGDAEGVIRVGEVCPILPRTLDPSDATVTGIQRVWYGIRPTMGEGT